MSNFGFPHLRVVNPYDVAFRNARSAVGAAATLATAEVYKTVAEAVADCSLVVGTTAVGHRDLQHSLVRLEKGAGAFERISPPAIVLSCSDQKNLACRSWI